MRIVETLDIAEPVRLTAERRTALNGWLAEEIEDAISARQQQEIVWRDALRLYEGVPKNPVRNTPIENAPNIEVTLGAIASDAIYAQAVDLLYTASPVVTARPIGARYVAHAKAMQQFIDWGVANEFGMRMASEHTILDDVQLGTGVYYSPWVEIRKKTKVHRVLSAGPRIFSVAPEDFFVPGGADADLQTVPWAAMRLWLTPGEYRERVAKSSWADTAAPCGIVGWVRSYREQLGRTTSSKRVSELYEVFAVYGYYDIDGDGIDEDLLILWDRSSKTILRAMYNPHEYRPFDAMRFQLRAHLFYGIGVIEMLKPYQEEATELHNARTTNVLIANARIWAGKRGQISETMRIWPNRVVLMDNPHQGDLVPLAMGDVYPSIGQAEAITIGLAERRTGINELSLPRPSQVLGSRTPGITALTLAQQVNRRFTPAFDAIRLATAGAVKQCIYRYQERLLAGDVTAELTISRVLPPEDAQRVIEVLRDESFDESLAIEMTATSASVSRDADRQNALLLVNILAQYYQRVLELVTIASNPQVPPAVKDVASKIAEKAGEIIDRTIRTFDQIRDPATFIVDVAEEMDNGRDGLSQAGLSGLSGMLGLLGGQAGNGAQPALAGADMGGGAAPSG